MDSNAPFRKKPHTGRAPGTARPAYDTYKLVSLSRDDNLWKALKSLLFFVCVHDGSVLTD